MNIPALPLQTGEDEEGQTFEIIFSAKGWASPPTLHNRAAQGLDVRHLPSPSPCGRGEVFSLDIPFYRTRRPSARWFQAFVTRAHAAQLAFADGCPER